MEASFRLDPEPHLFDPFKSPRPRSTLTKFQVVVLDTLERGVSKEGAENACLSLAQPKHRQSRKMSRRTRVGHRSDKSGLPMHVTRVKLWIRNGRSVAVPCRQYRPLGNLILFPD